MIYWHVLEAKLRLLALPSNYVALPGLCAVSIGGHGLHPEETFW
jgi:hypothetical protein